MKNDGTSFVATVDGYVFDDFQLKVDLDKNVKIVYSPKNDMVK
jgi:hypothetical protein